MHCHIRADKGRLGMDPRSPRFPDPGWDVAMQDLTPTGLTPSGRVIDTGPSLARLLAAMDGLGARH